MVLPARIGFCSGQPKSGTSFLQRVIDAHPDMVCPSECHLYYLMNGLITLLKQHNDLVRDNARATAQADDGVYFVQNDLAQAFSMLVKRLAMRNQGDDDCKWSMLKDNGIPYTFENYRRIFPNARFVFVVRDPRSVACSSWYSNLRHEPDFEKRAGSLDDWCEVVAREWAKMYSTLDAAIHIQEHAQKMLICRYEDMVLDPRETFTRIFNFLSVDATGTVVTQVAEETRFEKQARDPYFRRGGIDAWKEDLTTDCADRALKTAGPLASTFGYT